MRLSCKPARDALAFGAAQRRLRRLEGRRERGKLDLFYFDQSGFCLTPPVPYAWQQRAAPTAAIQARGHSRRLNVLGCWQRAGPFFSRCVEGRVNSESVVAAIDAFLDWHQAKVSGPARALWLVLDNASSHTSAHFRAQVARWRGQGLRLFFLPPYCPELNAIERVWQEIKHRWLDLSAYTDWQSLKKMLAEVLAGVGSKYRFTSE